MKRITHLFLGIFLLTALLQGNASAQVFCNNEIVYWSQDFGTGVNPSSNNNVTNLLTYQPTGDLETEGVYRVANSTHQKIEWHDAPDHTPGDVNGKMLVINGEDGTFFRRTVIRAAGYPAGFYSSSLFLMNVNTPGTCAPNPTLPAITFKIEYRNANNDWIELDNSPVTSGLVPQSATPTWMQLGGVFTLPTTGTFVVTRLRISLSDATPGSCGNDYAIDDIKLASCPEGGPVPVRFLSVTARQQGSGAAINWATGSESNNKYFDVERSTDNGINWSIVSTVQSVGNSSTTKNYGAYDAKPAAGANYYRIKQVDNDGTAKFSITVLYNLKITGTEISVLANPFKNNITVDFLSTKSQVLSYRLIEMSGKQVLAQQLNITKGSSRKVIDGVGKLNRGMYILQITDENGAILYNNKLIKE